MPKAMKIPAAKAAVNKEWDKLEKISAWDLTKVRSKSEVMDEARTKGAKSSFCIINGHLSFEECRIGDKAPKIQRSSCTPMRHCDRWFWFLCSIHRTRIISITNVSKSHGHHLRIAWLRWTSSWCSICQNPGNIRGRSQITQKSWIVMSRHLDSSTTTQMAKIMVQYGRPSRSSWAKSVWSSFGRTIMGKAIWENPIETWMGENSNLGMSLCSSWKRIILICICGWHKIGWQETKTLIRCGKYSKKLIWENRHLSLISCIPGMYSKTTWNKQRYCGQLQNHVRFANFRGEEQKNYHARKIWVFLRGPMTWKVMTRNVWNDIVSWQTRRLNNSTKCQLHALMTTTSKKKKWNLLKNCQKYALKLFWNAYNCHVLEDLIFYGQWTNLHDRSQNGPRPVTNDYLVWSLTFITHVNTINIAMWETQPSSADWDCFKTPLQEILRTRNLLQVEHCAFLEVIHLFQEVGCVRNKFQFRTVQQNQKSSLWILDWDWMVCPLWNYGIWLFLSLETRFRLLKDRGDPLSTITKCKAQSNDMKERPTCWITLIVFPQTSNFRIKKLCCMCLRTTKQLLRWLSREGVLQWDMFPEPTELLLIGCSIELIWTPKIQIKYIDTKKTNSQTCWPREISHVTNGIIICVCSTLITSVLPIVLEVMSKRTQEDACEERVTAKSNRWWIWSRDAA